MNEKYILHPPKDEALRKQLTAKLEEYKKRRNGDGKPWAFTHPKLAHDLYESYRDACYKIAILTKVLELKQGETLNTQDLSLELAKNYGNDFDASLFCIDCGVIANYLNGQKEKTIGGTGLPPAEFIKDLPQKAPVS